MTHSGGKPYAVGDHGQRYEVTCFDHRENARKVFGWSNDIEGAHTMVAAIDAHPVWNAPLIRDRHIERALRDMMTAYERRVRSDCKTEAELAAEPWRCLEYNAAEQLLSEEGSIER